MLNELIAFVLAAIALLGSPGPGIAALVAVGRSFRPAAAFRYYGAMQLGLALAAAISAAGLVSIIQATPVIQSVLMMIGTLYLLWLAWTIASSPYGGGAIGDRETASLTEKGAFLLGIANPKAYLAFASLLGSFTLLPQEYVVADGALKWALIVAVMVIVDLGWLALGMLFGKVDLSLRAEKALNIIMGATIACACVTIWL